MIKRRLLLVDLENIHKVDLSLLDESYQAIIYVGAAQNPPKAAKKASTAHRFARVDIQRIEGRGKNALDFHIAFQLGRTLETAPDTQCIVVSKDKGFDPLLLHLNKIGLSCRRIGSMEELVLQAATKSGTNLGALTICPRCHKSKTIEHHGGRWCSNCGSFASPADPALLPSNQIQERDSSSNFLQDLLRKEGNVRRGPLCGCCNQSTDFSTGIYDDGEWMCGDCIASCVT